MDMETIRDREELKMLDKQDTLPSTLEERFAASRAAEQEAGGEEGPLSDIWAS